MANQGRPMMVVMPIKVVKKNAAAIELQMKMIKMKRWHK
ncbi:hypothetical protein PTUN_b0088 [Pseudoalteromonas tunicata]|nr:hypothetical protein PTUN_b0088 [Pseudoalteromonas tunicata]